MVTPYSVTEAIVESKEYYVEEIYTENYPVAEHYVEEIKDDKDILWRIMAIITFIASIFAILYLCNAVVKIDSQLFAVAAALFMGLWLWFMYRKVL